MKTKLLSGCIFAMVVANSPVYAEIYKSVDGDGNTRYSDTPPNNTPYKSVDAGSKGTNVVAKPAATKAKSKATEVAGAAGGQQAPALSLGAAKAGSASAGTAGGGSAGGSVGGSAGSVSGGGSKSAQTGGSSSSKPQAKAGEAAAKVATSSAVSTTKTTSATNTAEKTAPTPAAADTPKAVAATAAAAAVVAATPTPTPTPTPAATPAPVVKAAASAPVAAKAVTQINAGGLPTVFFGLHLHRADSSTKWPDAQFGSWRLWDSKWRWSKIEPAKNVFDFTMSDKLINLAMTHKVEPLVTLGITPAWASSRPLEDYVYGAGGAAEPKDNKDWENYLTTIANRYKGKVKYYEVWNEPKFSDKEPVVDKTNRALGFYTGSSQKLVELSCSASKVLKAVDPTIKVLSPGFTGIGDRVSIFLDGGGKDCVDILAFHFYRDTPEIMYRDIQYIQGLMKASGAGSKELWATENGYDYIGIYDPNKKAFVRKLFDNKQDMDVLASYVPRNYVLAASAGVSRYFFYSWERVLSNNETTNTAAADNLGVTYRWLVGAKVGTCATTDKKVWTCPMTRNGRKAWMVWDVTGNSTWQPPLSYGVKSFETMTKGDTAIQNGSVDIGQTPVLLKVEPDDWVL